MVAYRHRMLLDADIAVPPPGGNWTNFGSRNDEANFDSNMVIILAALLCALVCALGLNSIVRCALRCTRRVSQDQTADHGVAARVALSKEVLSRIPVVVYKSGLDIKDTDCLICLGEFAEGEDVRIFPRCSHGFHVKCIDRWLALHSSCPTCRQPLIGHSRTANTEGHVRVEIN